MPQTDSTKQKPASSWIDACIKKCKTNNLLAVTIGLLVLVTIIALLNLLSGNGASRSESYKKAVGAAGLEAAISYDCTKSCKQKFNFNVYVFNDQGQQISVVRPDQHGKVNMALAEGDYVLLIGKQFGKDNLFPQEKVALKNGKSLELKLNYKE